MNVVLFCPKSHAGKVVLRSWYEKNKHIFPASRWEPYDPEKKWDKYTVRIVLKNACLLYSGREALSDKWGKK